MSISFKTICSLLFDNYFCTGPELEAVKFQQDPMEEKSSALMG
jgi:hypothetical protein